MYKIEFDAARRLFHVTAEGFWSLGTVLAFSSEVLARGAWARARYGRSAVLVDARKFPVQSAEVAHAIEVLTAKSVAICDAPYAIVTGSMLVKLQAERVVNAPNCRSFVDMEAALAWLDAEWEQRRAA